MSDQRRTRADGVAVTRDLDATREALTRWLAAQVPGRSEVFLSELTVPKSGGSSNETLLFDASWVEGGRTISQPLVARIDPLGLTHHHDTFEAQYRVQSTLSEHTNVPLPRFYGYETDPSVLGKGFWVMEQVTGQVPADNPPYNINGFVLEATPEQRRKLWGSAIGAMASVHTVPLELVDFLESYDGMSDLGENVKFWIDLYEPTVNGGNYPVAEQARDWLAANIPATPQRGLSWGDSRLGNMMFRDFECVALFDWEMVSLAGPLLDLGWWLFIQSAWPGPRLEGMGDRSETCELWEKLTGYSTADLAFYEIFAGYRIALSHIGHAVKMQEHGIQLPESWSRYPQPDDPIDYNLLASPQRSIQALERLLGRDMAVRETERRRR